jgi:hypothetical protein
MLHGSRLAADLFSISVASRKPVDQLRVIHKINAT